MTPATQCAGIAAAVLLAACSSAPPQSDAERRREQIATAQQRASGALARDDYLRAQSQYQVALDHGRAVEDQDAVAIGLLNLAAVMHRAGDLAAARTKLAEVIEHQPPFGAAYAGRAEARLALVELQSDRPEDASRHAQRAETLCPPADCPWRLALNNVRAAIALRSGDLDGADARARESLAAAESAKAAREQANAWRLLGEIAGERGRPAEARAAFQSALDLDRAAEVPERIALDLLALARLELALGDRERARAYAQRAANVAEGAHLAAPLAAARGLLREAR